MSMSMGEAPATTHVRRGDRVKARDGGIARGLALIVGTGLVLGLAYNFLGLRNKAWGLAWIAEDPTELATLDFEADAGAGTDGSAAGALPEPVSDDPMAIPAGAPAAAGLPEIPELGRPIQMQLPAVKRFYDADAVLIVDAREPHEFEEGHIAGAINLPYDEVITDPARLEALETGGRPIVVYCGGGSCELSISLGWELIRAGHPKVLVFMGGYPEWQEAGYPVETGTGGAG